MALSDSVLQVGVQSKVIRHEEPLYVKAVHCNFIVNQRTKGKEKYLHNIAIISFCLSRDIRKRAVISF